MIGSGGDPEVRQRGAAEYEARVTIHMANSALSFQQPEYQVRACRAYAVEPSCGAGTPGWIEPEY